MKTLLVVAVALVALCSSAAPASADVGSCYSVRPICLYPTAPVCMCDQAMRCFWACR